MPPDKKRSAAGLEDWDADELRIANMSMMGTFFPTWYHDGTFGYIGTLVCLLLLSPYHR